MNSIVLLTSLYVQAAAGYKESVAAQSVCMRAYIWELQLLVVAVVHVLVPARLHRERRLNCAVLC
jgi:hypothetical protein